MNTRWMPRSGLESLEELVWLPRLIDKARRHASGADTMNGYLYGNNDFIDRRVLDFLRTNDREFSALVCRHPEDAEAARAAVERSGRSAEERRAFSASLRRKLFDFVLLEADEGRLQPPFKRKAIAFFYNRVMMPPVNALFRAAERKRHA